MTIEDGNAQQARSARVLLLVDDEPNILAALRRVLRRDGYEIHTANSGAEALEVLERQPVGVIVSDQRMPGMTGTQFLSEVKLRFPHTTRMVLSGYTELNSITEAINQGAIYKFLTKPWDDDLLRTHVAEAFQRYELLQENARLAELNRAMLDAVSDIVLLVDPATMTIVSANQGAASRLGYPVGTLVGMPIAAIESLPQDIFYLEEIAAGEFRPLAGVETEYTTASGAAIPVRKSTAHACRGELNNIVVIARDITRERQVEHELAQASSRMAAIFEATAEGIAVIDNAGRLVGMNRRLADLWRLSDEVAFDGASLLAWMAGRCRDASEAMLQFEAALAESQSRCGGHVLLGDGRCVQWSMNPQRLGDEAVGQVFSFLDVTDALDAAAHLRQP
ncbi:MAG TPA: response regulator [Rhodocyclaceae bacterium]|nr:response regulator [Rhodocyclaceae bacterium]